MRSNDNPERIDFSSVPTTAEDVAALEHARTQDRLDPKQYLEFLLTFSKRHPAGREIPERHEPFVISPSSRIRA